jgi:hypothetical protein
VEPGAASPVIIYIDSSSAGAFRRNINGMLQPVHGLTRDQFVQLSQAQFDRTRAVVTSQGKTVFAGSPAYERRYRMHVGSQDLASWGIVTMRGGRPWLFTYTADSGRFDESLADVAALYSTVRLPT